MQAGAIFVPSGPPKLPGEERSPSDTAVSRRRACREATSHLAAACPV